MKTAKAFREIVASFRLHRRVFQRSAMVAFGSGVACYFWNVGRFNVPSIFQLKFSALATARSSDHPINVTALIVEKAAPAVVSIVCDQNAMFGMRQMASGSGFIVRSDGLVLTNAHVVSRARAVRVRLHDGRELDGIVQAIDPVSDLATVKLAKASNLPILPLGDSDSLRAGEWVAAIGSPLSLTNTVTAGIISTVHRPSDDLGIGRRGTYGHGMNYIQTDAAITFGNSGGPLVNVDGEAIGINTMKIESGISFAIPSNHARRFLEKVEAVSKGERVDEILSRKRYLGIEMMSLNSQIVQELRSRIPDFPNVTAGIYIHRVVPDSPASLAGLLRGDVIVQINGKQILTVNDLYTMLEDGTVKYLNVTIIRKNTTYTLRVAPELD